MYAQHAVATSKEKTTRQQKTMQAMGSLRQVRFRLQEHAVRAAVVGMRKSWMVWKVKQLQIQIAELEDSVQSKEAAVHTMATEVAKLRKQRKVMDEGKHSHLQEKAANVERSLLSRVFCCYKYSVAKVNSSETKSLLDGSERFSGSGSEDD